MVTVATPDGPLQSINAFLAAVRDDGQLAKHSVHTIAFAKPAPHRFDSRGFELGCPTGSADR
jgi:hypothetical protein